VPERRTQWGTRDPLPLEEVTQAAFNGVLRALEARKLPISHFPGPIIVGIVAWPELQPGQMFRAVEQEE
jgi:hypothetical protein